MRPLSKLFRSLDLRQTRVSEVNIRERVLGPQNPERPEGGFQGCQTAEAAPAVMSHMERRQLEAEQEAQRLVEDARQQAEVIRHEAEAIRRDAEVIQRDAYREGFAQGERGGERLALQKGEPVIRILQEICDALSNERAALIQLHEAELIKIAFVIATQVLKTTIELEPEVLSHVLEAALAKVAKAQEITLYLAPLDHQLIAQLMSKAGGGVWPPPHVTTQPDETVGRGGCRVESEAGDIDATIETQLRILKDALWGE